MSPRPPAFPAINEPENSLHRQMFPALARLIVEASRYSQIWLTSHSAELAALISSQAESRIYELENSDGETRIKAARPDNVRGPSYATGREFAVYAALL